MIKAGRSISRRRVLQGVAASGFAAGATAAIVRPAFAVPETVKIGLVGPRTGALALFYQEMGWAIDAVRKFTGNSITINGARHPLEIVVKDSQSDPNRASEMAQELILNDKVHIVTASRRRRPSIRFPTSARSTACRASATTARSSPIFRPQGQSEAGVPVDLQFLLLGRRGARGQPRGVVAPSHRQKDRRAVRQ
jgi:hypothetical protein